MLRIYKNGLLEANEEYPGLGIGVTSTSISGDIGWPLRWGERGPYGKTSIFILPLFRDSTILGYCMSSLHVLL
ncbi:hypothetical protein BDDG_11980 [Blastomyces dermatitidis ATCC 18188]|uniref:Uncharacterized protein n=1 Tax=Ajellomyces dermatitidis (strain ATCC 18188 / CBS 674.68) TaxID=653446 RepID=A0A0J9HDU3_AJEDA|nr:hypothetical protein BDDG_11980 [Blastomyces dermatitidis ATCC 18188]